MVEDAEDALEDAEEGAEEKEVAEERGAEDEEREDGGGAAGSGIPGEGTASGEETVSQLEGMEHLREEVESEVVGGSGTRSEGGGSRDMTSPGLGSEESGDV